MNDIVYITGHKNPDTDSICSAIAYANLKNLMNINAVPVRIGKINRETEFILNYFGFSEPEYLDNVKTQVSDIAMDEIDAVYPDVSIKDAWQMLMDKQLAVLPVQNEDGTLIGIVSVSDIAYSYMNMPASNVLSVSKTPIANVIRTLDAKVIYNSGKSFDGTGKAIIAAMTPGGLVEYIEKGDIVFVGDIRANQRKAIDSGASCVIVTCGSTICEEVIEFAKANECTLLVTGYDTFTSARLLYQSIPVQHTMTTDLIYFNDDEFIDDVKERMLQTKHRNFPVVDSAHRFKGFIANRHLLKQQKKKVILVDHSEMAQSINGIEQAEILEIVDHHRIGDVQTGSPIYYHNEPTGSTATIISNLYSRIGFTPSKEIAGLLCAAIISDTIKFKSPTSTNLDKVTAERLAMIADIDIESFSTKMFDAGTTLKGLSTEEIVQGDFKEYVVGKYKIGVGQVYTTDFNSLSSIKDSILEYLNKLLANKGYAILMILFTDIIEEKTKVLFVESQKGLVSKTFSNIDDKNSFSMNGVVSRKKQIVPALITSLG